MIYAPKLGQSKTWAGGIGVFLKDNVPKLSEFSCFLTSHSFPEPSAGRTCDLIRARLRSMVLPNPAPSCAPDSGTTAVMSEPQI